MLQNPCIRYDRSLKQKPSPTARAVYQHDLMETQAQMLMMGIMLKKDLHLMGLTPYLMTSTTSTL